MLYSAQKKNSSFDTAAGPICSLSEQTPNKQQSYLELIIIPRQFLMHHKRAQAITRVCHLVNAD